mmetsp:Transcript_24487/g.50934  ORF Transcript_24487/g.50934 Transcript_24487/m.50934 type:complete len:214 (+) Transcript_24487:269-910(+)
MRGKYSFKIKKNQKVHPRPGVQRPHNPPANPKNRLQFIRTSLSLGGFHGLEKTKAGILDCCQSGILVGGQFLVGFLELLDLTLEVAFSIIKLLFVVSNLGFHVRFRHGHVFLNLLFLLVIAEVNVRGRANGLEVLLGELFHGRVITSSLVILEVSRISPLNCGVSTDAIGITEGLALSSAIDVGDKLGRTVVKRVHELVPIGLHFLTVASPRR